MRVIAVAMVVSIAASWSFAQLKKEAQAGNAERGKYITENVAMCIQCHSPREADGALIRSKLFDGAAIPVGKPNQLSVWAEFAPRIAGLPQYSEEQMINLLTSGIGREGKPLRSPMPTFRLTRQDAEDVIAYLKSVK